MGDWTFATGDALTRKAWAKKWFMEAKTESYFYGNGFVGTSHDSIVVEFPDLEKDQGDKVTIGFLTELGGAGVANDSALEGSEDDVFPYDDAITLTQIRNAVRTAGRESEMRPSDKATREYAKELLRRWMAMTIDNAIFDCYTATTPTKILYGGDATTTGSIEAGDYMKLDLLSKYKTYAQKATYPIVGPTVKGKALAGVAIVCPDSEHDLVTYDSAWAQAQREAQKAGDSNPLFTAALGLYRNVLIHSHPRINIATTWGTGAINGAQNLVLGVKSASIAYSKKKIWEEKTFDYQNKIGFAVGTIYGVTKNVFNSIDLATVALYTYRSSN